MILISALESSVEDGREGFSKSEGEETARPAFARHVSEADADLVSFDIFDTVLTRNIGEPAALFHEVGLEVERRELVKCSALVFVQVRYASEQRARTNKSGREIVLHEIYDEVARVLNCEDRCEELMAIEMAAEARALRLIPEAAIAVAGARRRFGRVIFISDMYLPGGFIEEQLREHGLFFPGDRLYVSSEVGVQKGDGRLFRHVLKTENLAAGRLLHFGDSLRYDIHPARKLGIQACLCEAALLLPSEKALGRHSSWNGGYGAKLAGAARLARLSCPESHPDRRSMWNTGATVTGPLVLLYARWILERAARLGITQLYFLARDAYFPYLAVKALLANQPSHGLTARYVYGSRPTYLPLSVATLGEEEWNHLAVHGGEVCRTIKDLAAALMAREETIREFVHPLGFGDADLERILSEEEINRIRSEAIGNPGFNQALLKDIKHFQGLVKRYFEEGGFDPNQGTAIIDTGWTTRSHAPLFNFLKDLGCGNLKLLYLGIMVDKTHIPLESVEAFVFDHARRSGAIRREIYYARPCEALLFAEHGRTIGFKEELGVVVPILDAVENPKSLKKFFFSYSAGIQAFLDRATAGKDGAPSVLGLANLTEQIITRFWCEPTVEEARLWSKMDWQWDPQGRVVYPFARAYRMGDAWQAFRKSAFPECYPQFWVAGSRAISGGAVLSVLAIAIVTSRKLKNITKRWMPSRLLRILKPSR